MNKDLKMKKMVNVIPLGGRILLALLLCLVLLPIQQARAVEPFPTTIEITSISPSPAYIDQQIQVRVQAAAANPADGIPSGSVEIKSGQNRVCLFNLDAAGEGGCQMSFAAPAAVPLKAHYLGTDTYLPSVSAGINLLVNDKHTPVVEILSDTPDPSVIDRQVNVSVRLASDGPVPTGSVTVWSSDAACKTPPALSAADDCTFDLAAGAGSCSLALTAPGNGYLCAGYAGDAYTFPAQAAPEPHRVGESNTFTEITEIDPEPSLLGEMVWVYFEVSSPDGEPAPDDLVKVTSGSLTCTASIAEGRCTLTFTTPHLHDVFAEYQGGVSGELNNQAAAVVLEPSTSDVVVHRVNAAPTNILLSANRVKVFSTGKEIGEFSAIDPNTDETHVFTLVPGDGDQDNDLFEIQGDKLLVDGRVPRNRPFVTFRVRATDPAGLTFEKVFTLRVTTDAVLPETGFAAGQVTKTHPQPQEKRYQVLNSITLEIPALDVHTDITGVPFTDDGWDTDWLWNQAGWLHGTAFPGWPGNSVLAAHNFLPSGKPGPFAGLQNLAWGDQVLVRAYGEMHVYEVRSVEVVSPKQASVLRHEETPWLTLVTCKSFDENSGTYRQRVIVRAVLVEIR